MAAVAGEEVRSSNTDGSRLFKLCRGFYSSIKNEKKTPYLSSNISHASSGLFQLMAGKKQTEEMVESKVGP